MHTNKVLRIVRIVLSQKKGVLIRNKNPKS